MATIKQLNKQIETANKRIADYHRKVEMYHVRTIKACNTVNVSIDDIETQEAGGFQGRKWTEYKLPVSIANVIGFDASYRITSNYESMKENERHLANENRHVASLIEQRDKMISDAENYEKATAGLQAALEQAMVDFRAVWFTKMREWYKNHYQFIQTELPRARRRNERANECRRYFSRTRGWHWCRTSKMMRYLDNVCKSSGEIIMDDAARMDFDVYMDVMEQETTKSWNNGIILLTNKCHKFGLRETELRVNHPAMTEKGFSAIITDGTTRVVDVRVIWVAEYSAYVAPHIRYIATQKNK